MTNQLLLQLKNKLDNLSVYGPVDPEVKRNALKEELQFYVLNFIYHHPVYNSWIMYGGSSLRICHGLNRMSVDLDFEIPHPGTEDFLKTLEREVRDYFIHTYAIGAESLTTKITNDRGVTLKFILSDDFNIGHASKQVHVKIDVNHFTIKKLVTERIPINHDQLSFVITAYNMSALMASKIAAIFSRGKRGIGGETFAEKGRDIYDLLWYMEKRIVPDLDYLQAKVPEAADLRILFDRLTIKMNTVSDKNLSLDLTPLFVEQSFIQNWLVSWRASYLRLVESYDFRTVTRLERIRIGKEFRTDVYFFHFIYATKEGSDVTIDCALSDYWLEFGEGDLAGLVDLIKEEVILRIEHMQNIEMNDRLRQYVSLFYKKAEDYMKKTNHIILGDRITTKVVRMTAGNLNQKEQIVLNKSALLWCELEDLLK